MSRKLTVLLARLSLAAESGDLDAFEDLVSLTEAATASLAETDPELRADIWREVAAQRASLVRSPGFLNGNERLMADLAAAEAAGDEERVAALSDALHRRSEAVMATLSLQPDNAEPLSEAAEALFEAIDAGDLDRTRASLVGLDINARHGGFEETALAHAMAAEGRSIEMVQFLLEMGADPEAGMADGCTPLHLLCAYPWGWEPRERTALFARILVDAGAKVEAQTTTYGWTPLHRAVMEGNTQEMEALLRVRANPNLPYGPKSQPWFSPGRLPLQIAGSDPEKVRLLLDYGANPHRTDIHGEDVATYLERALAATVSDADAHEGRARSRREGLEASLKMVRSWPPLS